MSLRWYQKLTVKIAGIGLIFFALLAFSLHWSYSSARSQMVESSERDAQKLAHSVNASILTFVLSVPEGGALIKDLVVKLNENLNGVTVRIAHSRSLDQQYGVHANELVNGRNEAESLDDGRERFWEDGDNWRYAMPIKAVTGCGKCHVLPDGSGQAVPDGYVIAIISFAASTKPMKDRLAQLRKDLARNLAIIGVLFIVMALFVTAYVTKPLEVMLAAMQSVAGGNMEARAPVSQDDEIGRLGGSFNAMAEQMQTSLNRIESWNIDLAEEVERQTQSICEMRDRHQAIIDSTQRIIVTTDHEMTIESVNAEFDIYAFRSNMPIRSSDLVGRPVYAFLADDEKEHLKKLCDPLLAGSKEPCGMELDVGLGVENRSFIITISPLANLKAEVVGLVFVLLDVTEKKLAERALEFERDKLNAIMEGMDAAVTIITRDGGITYMNRHMEALFGKANMGRPCWETVIGSQERCEGCDAAFLTGRVNLEVKAVNGAIYLAMHSAITDIDGKKSVVVVLEDITYLKDMEGKLRRLVITDKLTGLYNKRHFTERLTDEMARAARHNTPLSLLFADIDKFKSYNDTYGHVGGDLVLSRLGEIVRESVRAHVDTGYRYGGEEFTVILPGAGAGEALAVAERIKNSFAAHTFRPAVNGVEIDVRKTISIGLATIEGKEDMDTFIGRADTLMYGAKKEGGNKVRLAG